MAMDSPPVEYARSDDDVRIAYQTVGDGPPVLLLHPMSLTNLSGLWHVPSFREAYELIAEDFRLVLLDPRATGLSGSSEDLGAEAFVGDIRAVLASVGGGPAAVIAVKEPWRAVRFAAAHPELTACLVLLAPDFDPEQELSVRQALEENLGGLAPERMKRLLNPSQHPEDEAAIAAASEENRRRRDKLGVADRIEALRRSRVDRLLPALSCRTLVVHYPERSFTDGARVSNLIPDARLVVREGANGPLLNPDLPELFELVLDFIQEHASSGAVGGSDSAVQATSVVLTPQQLVVLRRVAAGDTDPEIAEALGIQPSTVSRHVHHILRKVGARNRAEAVSWGFTNHVLPG